MKQPEFSDKELLFLFDIFMKLSLNCNFQKGENSKSITSSVDWHLTNVQLSLLNSSLFKLRKSIKPIYSKKLF